MPKTAKVIALYRQPTDPRWFDDYYTRTHAPLVRKIPGLRRFEVNRVTGTPGGASDIYQVAQLVFDDAAARDRALGSPEAKAVVDDLANFATGIASVYLAEGGDL